MNKVTGEAAEIIQAINLAYALGEISLEMRDQMLCQVFGEIEISQDFFIASDADFIPAIC